MEQIVSAVEQIVSECSNGECSIVYSWVPQNLLAFKTTEANFSTSTTEDCAFWVSFELGDLIFLFSLALFMIIPGWDYSVTHCVGTYALFIVIGSCLLLLLPIFPQPVTHLVKVSWDALEEVLTSAVITMCVNECLSLFQLNTTNECVCLPGTTGHNCTEGKSQICTANSVDYCLLNADCRIRLSVSVFITKNTWHILRKIIMIYMHMCNTYTMAKVAGTILHSWKLKMFSYRK